MRGIDNSTHRVWWTGVALALALFPSCSTYSQELNAVALQFLQRHGVPCRLVLKVGSPHDLSEVATCQDGREWALFWLEDEIAFIHRQTREPYKWERETYISHPGLYSDPKPSTENQTLSGDGP
jgi:hypothetical protein